MPSWSNFLKVGGLGVVSGYALGTHLVESLIILAGMISVPVILPMKWFQDNFVALDELGRYFVRGIVDLAILSRNKFGAV